MPESTTIPYLGEILSFGTAFIWAISVILFKKSGETVGPLALNLYKNALSFVLMIPTMLLLGISFFPAVPVEIYGLCLLGGLLSIGLADTTFFRALNLLGAGRFAVIDTLYSPSIIFFAFLFLGERLSVVQGCGVAAVVSAVLLTTLEKLDERFMNRRRLLIGSAWGLASVIFMAAGLVLIKPVLEQNHLLWVTFWRVVGGLLSLGVFLSFHPRRGQILRALLLRKGRGYTFFGSFIGAYLVTLTWLGGMKYTSAGIASALNQTSTVLTFLFAALLLKEPLSLRHGIAIVIAFSGALAVTFG